MSLHFILPLITLNEHALAALRPSVLCEYRPTHMAPRMIVSFALLTSTYKAMLQDASNDRIWEAALQR